MGFRIKTVREIFIQHRILLNIKIINITDNQIYSANLPSLEAQMVFVAIKKMILRCKERLNKCFYGLF